MNMNPVQELVTSWLNPTALFFIVNLMIVTIFILKTHQKNPSSTKHNDDNRSIQENHHHHQQDGPAEVLRVPSLFERVRSFNYISKNQSTEPEHAEPAEPTRESPVEKQHHVDDHIIADEQHEESTGDGGNVMIRNSYKVLKKSESEKVSTASDVETVELRRPETTRERAAVADENDEAVDAKADDFINRFRQQLKMQRLDSILRYREMLNRGVAR